MARRRQQSKKKRAKPLSDAQLIEAALRDAQRWQAELRRERRAEATGAELRSNDRRRSFPTEQPPGGQGRRSRPQGNP